MGLFGALTISEALKYNHSLTTLDLDDKKETGMIFNCLRICMKQITNLEKMVHICFMIRFNIIQHYRH